MSRKERADEFSIRQLLSARVFPPVLEFSPVNSTFRVLSWIHDPADPGRREGDIFVPTHERDVKQRDGNLSKDKSLISIFS